jgi:hypothetical protein
MENPQNPGGFVTKCTGSELQEQFHRSLYEISSLVEPAKANFARLLGQFSTEEMLIVTSGMRCSQSPTRGPDQVNVIIVIITVGMDPVEASFLKPWASV